MGLGTGKKATICSLCPKGMCLFNPRGTPSVTEGCIRNALGAEEGLFSPIQSLPSESAGSPVTLSHMPISSHMP
jgi:hypothetical protein